MALIYEHWRPDTNECFYVGASWSAEKTRPYYYGPHNDDYDEVIQILKSNGLSPFTKIIWVDLEDDCVGAYEKIRIAYRRSLLGKKLTNRAKGGQGFDAAMWWDSLAPDERYDFLIRRQLSQQKRWDEISDEDRALHSKATSAGLVKYHQNISEEEYIKMCARNMVNSRMYYDNLTDAGKAQHAETRKVSSQKMWDEMSDLEKNERGRQVSAGLRKRSKEERTASALKTWETRRKNDAIAEAEGKLTSAAKTSISHKSRSPEDIKSSHEKRVAVCRQKDEIRKASGQPTSHEKAWETRRRNGTDKINPNRSRTKEEKTAEGKKGWETRRRNKAEALAAKEKSNALF